MLEEHSYEIHPRKIKRSSSHDRNVIDRQDVFASRSLVSHRRHAAYVISETYTQPVDVDTQPQYAFQDEMCPADKFVVARLNPF